MAALAHAPCKAQSADSTAAPVCGTGTANAYLEVNNVRALIPNTGGLFWRPDLEGAYEVPKGGGAHSLFSASLWVGGYIDEQLHTAGSTYGPYEFWPGPLDESGQPLADCTPFDRIWSVGREDVEYYERTGIAWRDLADWPTGLGAPTTDAAGRVLDLSPIPLSQRVDRIINLEAGERPFISGDRMLWWIMNDAGGPHEFSGSPPIGLEVQMSAFAYLGEGALANTTFYKLRMRKPAGPPLEDSFLGMFVRPQVGVLLDDFLGSDTLLGLAYAYNEDDRDGFGLGEPGAYLSPPPAIGLDFFRGPLASDSPKHACGGSNPGEPLGMTSFVRIYNGGGVQGHPSKAQDLYYYITGRWKDGQRFTLGGNGRDFSNIRACFLYPGAPPEFWSEYERGASFISPTDRTFLTSSGPFRLGHDEFQEVLLGIITSFGSDNLDSIRQLKADDQFVQNLVDTGVIDGPSPTPSEPLVELVNNGELAASFYPNPASDMVSLKLSLAEALVVSVSVSDLVGRHRATILSGFMEAGSYEQTIDVSDWAPGVYLVRLQVGPRSYSRHIVVAR